jgi:hypothetical protein
MSLKDHTIDELKKEIINREKYPINLAVGYMKEDIRYIGSASININFGDYIVTDSKFHDIISEFIKSVDLIKKGTKFVKIQFEEEDEGSWYDDTNFGIENMDDDWANKYLEKIEKI